MREGWTGIEVSPWEGKYECRIVKGQTKQFEASLNGEAVDVTWKIVGDVDEGTSVTDGGLVTVAENESHPQFAVTVEDADGNLGTDTIKMITEEQAEK